MGVAVWCPVIGSCYLVCEPIDGQIVEGGEGAPTPVAVICVLVELMGELVVTG